MLILLLTQNSGLDLWLFLYKRCYKTSSLYWIDVNYKSILLNMRARLQFCNFVNNLVIIFIAVPPPPPIS